MKKGKPRAEVYANLEEVINSGALTLLSYLRGLPEDQFFNEGRVKESLFYCYLKFLGFNNFFVDWDGIEYEFNDAITKFIFFPQWMQNVQNRLNQETKTWTRDEILRLVELEGRIQSECLQY